MVAMDGMTNVFESATADGRVVLVGGGFGEVVARSHTAERPGGTS